MQAISGSASLGHGLDKVDYSNSEYQIILMLCMGVDLWKERKKEWNLFLSEFYPRMGDIWYSFLQHNFQEIFMLVVWLTM